MAGSNGNSFSHRNNKAKVATVSDLLHRVAASCLSQRLPGTRAFDEDGWSSNSTSSLSPSASPEKHKEKEALNSSNERKRESLSAPREDSVARAIAREKEREKLEDEEEEKLLRMWEENKDKDERQNHLLSSATFPRDKDHHPDADSDFKEQLKAMEALLAQVFHSVSSVKHAYRTLQHSHSPWDPHRMQAADAAVVSELRNLDTLRDQYRRARSRAPTSHAAQPAPSLAFREAVAPYEAALDDLKKELKVKEAEAENLRHKLRYSEMLAAASHKGRSRSSKWSKGLGVGAGNLFCFLNVNKLLLSIVTYKNE